MSAHELARKLLEGPDVPVVYKNSFWILFLPVEKVPDYETVKWQPHTDKLPSIELCLVLNHH